MSQKIIFKSDEEFIQKYDELKNEWCKNNNIALIRIPYTHLNRITIEDLKIETSNFILK